MIGTDKSLEIPALRNSVSARWTAGSAKSISSVKGSVDRSVNKGRTVRPETMDVLLEGLSDGLIITRGTGN